MDRPDFANLTAAGEQLAASAKHILGGGMPGAALDKLHFPTALVVEAEGDETGGDVLLLSDAMNHRVLRVTYKGPETPLAVEVVCGTGRSSSRTRTTAACSASRPARPRGRPCAARP